MKRLQYGAMALCALLTAAGALSPWLVSRLQDTYVESRTETRTFDPVSLTLQTGGDTVRLQNLSGGYDHVLWTGETNLTPEEVSAAAAEAVHMLAEGGYIYDFWEDEEPQYLEPNLVIPAEETGSSSAVVWICSLSAGMCIIDDKSGKMVAMDGVEYKEELQEQAYITTDNTAAAGPEVEYWTNIASKWATILSRYYGLEVSLGEAESREYCVAVTLHFRAQNERDTCEIPLTFYGTSHVAFNL